MGRVPELNAAYADWGGPPDWPFVPQWVLDLAVWSLTPTDARDFSTLKAFADGKGIPRHWVTEMQNDAQYLRMRAQLQKAGGYSQSQIDAVKDNLLRLASTSNDTRAVLAFLELVGEMPSGGSRGSPPTEAVPAEMTPQELNEALLAQGLPPLAIYELPAAPAPPDKE